MNNQKTKVTTPLSTRRGAGGEAINPKDLDLHPCYSQYDIWYNVKDYENCQQVRFYTRAKRNQCGHRKGEFYEIPVHLKDTHASLRKRGIKPNTKPYLRRFINLRYKGKTVNLYCSHLVFKIGWTFPIKNPRLEVIDHISEDSLDDRRNNLCIKPASENVNTPACHEARLRNIGIVIRLNKSLTQTQRHEVKAHRQRIFNLTGHMPSLEDAIRDLGLEKGGAK